jgi:hypothetical protein
MAGEDSFAAMYGEHKGRLKLQECLKISWIISAGSCSIVELPAIV